LALLNAAEVVERSGTQVAYLLRGHRFRLSDYFAEELFGHPELADVEGELSLLQSFQASRAVGSRHTRAIDGGAGTTLGAGFSEFSRSAHSFLCASFQRLSCGESGESQSRNARLRAG
jgi:hypothetical protein